MTDEVSPETIERFRGLVDASRERVNGRCRGYRHMGAILSREGDDGLLELSVQGILRDVGLRDSAAAGPGWWQLAGKFAAAFIEGWVVDQAGRLPSPSETRPWFVCPVHHCVVLVGDRCGYCADARKASV